MRYDYHRDLTRATFSSLTSQDLAWTVWSSCDVWKRVRSSSVDASAGTGTTACWKLTMALLPLSRRSRIDCVGCHMVVLDLAQKLAAHSSRCHTKRTSALPSSEFVANKAPRSWLEKKRPGCSCCTRAGSLQFHQQILARLFDAIASLLEVSGTRYPTLARRVSLHCPKRCQKTAQENLALVRVPVSNPCSAAICLTEQRSSCPARHRQVDMTPPILFPPMSNALAPPAAGYWLVHPHRPPKRY